MSESAASLCPKHQQPLQVPKTRLVMGGDRVFSVISPKLWNNALPIDVNLNNTLDSFKVKLKTFYDLKRGTKDIRVLV